MDLTGQVVLITGGSRGLGRAFAQALLAAGARVAIIDILAAELHETAAQLSSAANQVVAIRADVTDPQAAPQVVTTVEERLGPITLLINNAGQFRAFGPIGVVDPIAWWNEVEVNLRGPFLYANAVLPGMRRRHRGRIINLASRAGIQGIPTLSAYVTSKAALFRTVYAQELDTPIERPVYLALRLAAGDADALSGRYISVEDDLDALLKECSADPSADQRLLRVNGVPAFYGGWWKRL